MKRWLFSGPRWNEAAPILRRKSLTEVRDLNRHFFLQAELAQRLEDIAKRYEFDVATLGATSHGETRLVDHVQKRLGKERVIKVTMLDAIIPFVGSESSFRFQPSRGAPMCVEHQVGYRKLILSVPYDNNTKSEIDDLRRQVSENLDMLRSELAAFAPHLRQAIRSAAAARIEDEKIFDGDLGFAIR